MSHSYKPNYAVAVPVLNGGSVWESCAAALHAQKPGPGKTLVIDSGSTDNSIGVTADAGFDLIRIDKHEFDHGGTRMKAVEYLRDYDVIVFLTQDAVPASQASIANLVKAFDNSDVGVAYGRQLPRPAAGAIEAHLRLFNYPEQSSVRSLADIPRLGIKTAFVSNSFAAYRTRALFAAGGFPSSLILGEDMVAAARMLRSGWSIAYVSDACVFHSHAYGIWEEFQRYFDIGVMHRDQAWLIDELGSPENEGSRFVRKELDYLLRTNPWLIPSAFIRNAMKYLGYKLGQRSESMPNKLKRNLSMHPRFWRNKS